MISATSPAALPPAWAAFAAEVGELHPDGPALAEMAYRAGIELDSYSAYGFIGRRSGPQRLALIFGTEPTHPDPDYFHVSTAGIVRVGALC